MARARLDGTLRPSTSSIRFTDHTVELGSEVSLSAQGAVCTIPNHPQLPDPVRQQPGYNQPSVASLHGDVRQSPEGSWTRRTPKSQEQTGCRIVRTGSSRNGASRARSSGLPPTSRFIAVSVQALARDACGEGTRQAAGHGAPGSAAGRRRWRWSSTTTKVADIPAELNGVGRGSVLNFLVEDAEGHPSGDEGSDRSDEVRRRHVFDGGRLDGRRDDCHRKLDTTSKALTAPGRDVDRRCRRAICACRTRSRISTTIRRFTLPKVDPKAAAGRGGRGRHRRRIRARRRAPRRRGRAGCF